MFLVLSEGLNSASSSGHMTYISEAMQPCTASQHLLSFLSTTSTMNVNVTTSNNNMNNIIGLDPRALQAINGGGFHTLEIVAESVDAPPLQKVAVVETLAIIEIVKVCSPTPINLPHLSNSLG